MRDDLSKWYPAVSGRVKVTLVEALPNILPSFGEKLANLTAGVFRENEIQILTQHTVKDVDEKCVTVKNKSGEKITIPMGMLVWAAGNAVRPLTRDLQGQFKDVQDSRRGLLVDGYLSMKGAKDVFVIGDAAATDAPPTAQVANQQGRYLASHFAKLASVEAAEAKLTAATQQPKSAEATAEAHRLEKKLHRLQASLKPFQYTSRGAMAYIGHEQAIIQIPFGEMEVSSAGVLTGLAVSDAPVSELALPCFATPAHRRACLSAVVERLLEHALWHSLQSICCSGLAPCTHFWPGSERVKRMLFPRSGAWARREEEWSGVSFQTPPVISV